MENQESWFNGFGEHAGELAEGAMDGMRDQDEKRKAEDGRLERVEPAGVECEHCVVRRQEAPPAAQSLFYVALPSCLPG